VEIVVKTLGVFIVVIFGLCISQAYGQSGLSLTQETLWKQGRKYLAEGKAAEAKSIFEDLLKKYPREPDLHLFSGIASLRLQDTQAAEININKVLVLAPDHVEARALLGWLKMEVHKDYPAAIKEYVRVIELKPDTAEAFNNLGVAYKKNGDLEKAVESFNRALELRQDYSEAWSNRGWSYAEQRRWSEARKDFERVLELNPDDQGALYGLSRVLREQRDYAGAQKALKSLIARSPNFVYWLEWGQIQLVRYYWVGILIAVALLLRSRYRRIRRESNGG